MGEDAVDVRQADSTARTAWSRPGAGTQSRRATPRGASSSRRSRSSNSSASSRRYQGQARRRPRRVDRQFPRLHAGQGPARRRPAQPALYLRQGADRRRRDAGLRRSSWAAWRPPASLCSRSSPNKGLWVDANPKESDLTYVTPGLPASVTIDTFPGREWKGSICSIAPGTGAQFAILPPQNASGNWVKVVQRIPLRFCFDPKEDMTGLRAGMSADRLDRHRPHAQPERALRRIFGWACRGSSRRRLRRRSRLPSRDGPR